ncbi:unnamed protein product (macronuclear) [Paramecium tetraurelia]|uniref:Uncharacterized protein n=1 Tax=Paramecium tetraurelia TaxID=5888 RepID=A0BNS6_PARTE|nr:uncharacterized protein GSPATT00030832001 [Paramecium tetraurelia]CAK60193.1 unnamed protein product [Paramecium tetraurelia]|eukprot:XP_001427591.1 hypothetical protein (macronuclear) [Paramecium tetraurelia strain d4-2]
MGSTLLCPQHQKPITQLNITKGQEKRIFCTDCDTENQTLISFEEAMKLWQNLEGKAVQKFLNFKNTKVPQLDQLLSKFQQYREQALKFINSLIETTDDYRFQFQKAIDREINQIKALKEDMDIKKLKEISEILSEKLTEEENENNHVGNLNLERVLIKEKELFSELKKNSLMIHLEIKKLIQQNQQEVKIRPVNFQQINSIKQQYDCYALAFNKAGNVVVSGSGKDIIVWKFEQDKLTQLQTLSGHNYNVNCLTFSQNQLFFVSGACDSQIMIWREQAKNNWKCDQTINEHANSICSLIISQNDDFIYSCSLDNSIKVWVKNLDNQFEQYQSLLGHTGSVYSISLNLKETQLISSSRDKSIIVWEIGEDKLWKKLQIIQNDDYGYRIAFISNVAFFWQRYGNGVAQIYLFDKQLLNYKILKRINMKEQLTDGYYLCPSIFHKKQHLIISKHSKNFYILRKLQNNRFSLLQTIEFPSSTLFGAISVNADYLIVWNDKTKDIQIWKNQ